MKFEFYLRFCCAGWRSWSYESDQTGRLLQDRTGSLLILRGDLKAPQENNTFTTSYLFILSQNICFLAIRAGSDIKQTLFTFTVNYNHTQFVLIKSSRNCVCKLPLLCNETLNICEHSCLVAENLHFFLTWKKCVSDRFLNQTLHCCEQLQPFKLEKKQVLILIQTEQILKHCQLVFHVRRFFLEVLPGHFGSE